MMARQPIPDVGLTIMVKSVINDLAGTAGFVRVSLLSSVVALRQIRAQWRDQARLVTLLAFDLQIKIKCERIEGSNNSQKLQGEGIFSSLPVTRPDFQETRGNLK